MCAPICLDAVEGLSRLQSRPDGQGVPNKDSPHRVAKALLWPGIYQGRCARKAAQGGISETPLSRSERDLCVYLCFIQCLVQLAVFRSSLGTLQASFGFRALR